MENPLVTICVPVKNGELFIRETLESILQQTYQNTEVLIGENCSTDKTRSIIEEYLGHHQNLRMISYETPLTFAQSCNKLIREARGQYVALFHADDVYNKSIIEKSVAALEKYRDLVGVFSSGNIINAASQVTRLYPGTASITEDTMLELNNYIDGYFNDINPLICPSSVIRKDAYVTTNGFDETLKLIEDLDMWLRLLKMGNLMVLSEHLISYRMHAGQGSQIYGDRTRVELSFPLQYMKSFIEKNDMMKRHRHLLNKAMAKDYLKIAFFAANRKKYSVFSDAINKSRLLYKFYRHVPYMIFQNGIKKINYLIARFLGRSFMKINKPTIG